jgi:hypothetical protein
MCNVFDQLGIRVLRSYTGFALPHLTEDLPEH